MSPNSRFPLRRALLMAALLTPAFHADAQTNNPPPNDPNAGRNFVAERAEMDKAWKMLSHKWRQHAEAQATKGQPKPPLLKQPLRNMTLPQLEKMELEMKMMPPERESLARRTLNGYTDPEELRSRDGVLTAVLVATYAKNYIGEDPVYLRSYNGHLVGPTLRVKPGDTLRITVKNDLPTQPWKKDSMNTLHDFNTTNLHTHGLHVSPNGISDNVLIEIGPGASQDYEIVIPKDHPCGTFWYHAHHHGSTAANVASGMSGALIIEGDLDKVPEIKAAKERVMVLNQIPYIYKNTLDDGNGGTVTFNFPEGIIEEKLAGYIFGPGDWAALGRYTTVNGVQLPVIRMNPGQIERWRIVDSGQREQIDLQLTAMDGTSPGIPFHEIAVDGLPLGKSTKKDVLELFPGYRSDVLVQAPDKPGEYLLVDQAVTSGINGEGEPLKYVARVVVDGSPVSMKLPPDSSLAQFRLPTLKDSKIDLQQTAVYGILPTADGNVRFTIDGESFNMDEAKELLLGNTDEWTVKVKNGGTINTGHPFHIHVNPFEIFSIMGPKDPSDPNSPQVEQLTDGPVWRDTIWVPNNGTVKFRTQYTEFIGTFVQHCHILDHEDQGMMQLVDITDPKAPATTAALPSQPVPAPGTPAPAFNRPDATGTLRSQSEFAGQRHVVFLFKGHGCLHCSQQVAEFTALHEQFKAKGIRVIGITTDKPEVLKAALAKTPSPFPILSDPDGQAFAAYGCSRSNGLTHGTFLVDEKGAVAWRTTGSGPYMNISSLLEETPKTTTAKASPNPEVASSRQP